MNRMHEERIVSRMDPHALSIWLSSVHLSDSYLILVIIQFTVDPILMRSSSSFIHPRTTKARAAVLVRLYQSAKRLITRCHRMRDACVTVCISGCITALRLDPLSSDDLKRSDWSDLTEAIWLKRSDWGARGKIEKHGRAWEPVSSAR